MGGKGGGGGGSQVYQQQFTGKDYETTSAEMDREAAAEWARQQVASDAWARGDRPPEAEKAKPKDPVPKIFQPLPAPGGTPPKPPVVVSENTFASPGLGDVLASGLGANPLTGQV